jgi:hypothetical protein
MDEVQRGFAIVALGHGRPPTGGHRANGLSFDRLALTGGLAPPDCQKFRPIHQMSGLDIQHERRFGPCLNRFRRHRMVTPSETLGG